MLVKHVDLKKVQKALRYDRVREVVERDLVRYEIEATNTDWPGAYLVLAQDAESKKYMVLQAGFGPWHCHFTQYQNPDRNVGAALACLAEIVSGKVHLVAGFNAQGSYVAGRLMGAKAQVGSELHGVLGQSEAVKYRSYRFNRAPEELGAFGAQQFAQSGRP